MGGFTPHYSPPPTNPFQPTHPAPYFPHQTQYDGMPPHSMDNFQPPPLPPRRAKPPHPQPPSYYPPQNMDPDTVSPPASNSNLNSISSMNAIERSRQLRIAKTTPYLQMMVGPLLRYDTIEDGVWRGAVLIVSKCALFNMRFSSRNVIHNLSTSTKLRMLVHIMTHHQRFDSTTTIPLRHRGSVGLHISTERRLGQHPRSALLPAVITAYNTA